MPDEKVHRLLKGSKKIKEPKLTAQDPEGVDVVIEVVTVEFPSIKSKDGKKTRQHVVVRKGNWVSPRFPGFNQVVDDIFTMCKNCTGIPEKVAEFADVLHRPVLVVKENDKIVILKPSVGYKSPAMECGVIDPVKGGTLITKSNDPKNPGAREVLNYQLRSDSPNVDEYQSYKAA